MHRATVKITRFYHFMWTITWDMTFWNQVLERHLCPKQKADSIKKKQIFRTHAYQNTIVNYTQQKSSLRPSAKWDGRICCIGSFHLLKEIANMC